MERFLQKGKDSGRKGRRIWLGIKRFGSNWKRATEKVKKGRMRLVQEGQV